MGALKTAHADSVDDYLNAQMSARHIPGLSIAVVQDGKVVKAQGYGMANVKPAVPASAGTIYSLGSISKQFTAVGIMLLAQEKKVGLDDPLSKYLPAMPETWRSITVRELLNQTSGIPEWVPDRDKDRLLETHTLSELARRAAAKPLAFEPGTQYAYSNTNYNLLAGIIEKAGGKPYGDFLQERLFKPLGMDATGIYDPKATVPGRAAGYNRVKGKIYKNIIFYDLSIYAGAGGLQSTVGDLAKWDLAVAGGKVLSLPVMAQMWTPPVLSSGSLTDYGMGWMNQDVKGHRMIWHNGAIPGYMGFSGRFPDDHLSIVILSNLCPLDGFDDNPPFFSLGLNLAKLYVPDLAKEEVGIPDSDPQTAALLKKVIGQFTAGTVNKSLFAPSFQALLTPATLDSMHTSLSALGPLTSLTLLKRAPDGSARYRALYGATAVSWLIALDKDRRISLLTFQSMN